MDTNLWTNILSQTITVTTDSASDPDDTFWASKIPEIIGVSHAHLGRKRER